MDEPTRRDALTYYRSVVRHFGIPVRQQHRVTRIDGASGDFRVQVALPGDRSLEMRAKAVVVATGYFGSPNRLGVPGEDAPHVTHIYREGHEAFDQDDPRRFTRSWFAWANSLYGELMLDLLRRKPALLRHALS